MLSEEDGRMISPSALMARHVGIEPTWARLSPAAQILCPLLFFFFFDPWEKEIGRAWGVESLSEKKAIRERREARLKHSQCEHSAPLNAASEWDFPKRDTHSARVSSVCRGFPHVLQWRRGICNKAALKFALLLRLFQILPDSSRGWPNLKAGRCKSSNPAAVALQRQISASAKSQQKRVFVAEEKKSELWRQSGRLYSQSPHLFWRAMAGCIAIGSRTATEPLVRFLVLQNGCAFTLLDKKGFSWRGKNEFFPYKRLRCSTSEISKGNKNYTWRNEHVVNRQFLKNVCDIVLILSLYLSLCLSFHFLIHQSPVQTSIQIMICLWKWPQTNKSTPNVKKKVCMFDSKSAYIAKYLITWNDCGSTVNVLKKAVLYLHTCAMCIYRHAWDLSYIFLLVKLTNTVILEPFKCTGFYSASIWKLTQNLIDFTLILKEKIHKSLQLFFSIPVSWVAK